MRPRDWKAICAAAERRDVATLRSSFVRVIWQEAPVSPSPRDEGPPSFFSQSTPRWRRSAAEATRVLPQHLVDVVFSRDRRLVRENRKTQTRCEVDTARNRGRPEELLHRVTSRKRSGRPGGAMTRRSAFIPPPRLRSSAIRTRPHFNLRSRFTEHGRPIPARASELRRALVHDQPTAATPRWLFATLLLLCASTDNILIHARETLQGLGHGGLTSRSSGPASVASFFESAMMASMSSVSRHSARISAAHRRGRRAASFLAAAGR